MMKLVLGYPIPTLILRFIDKIYNFGMSAPKLLHSRVIKSSFHDSRPMAIEADTTLRIDKLKLKYYLHCMLSNSANSDPSSQQNISAP